MAAIPRAVRAPEDNVPAFNPLSSLPVEKAARVRLYDIKDKKQTYLTNKEGVNFRAPANDVVYLAGFSETKYVNKTQLSEVVRKLDGFFWIRFRKKSDGSVRSMYAMLMKPKIVGNLSLHDLSLPNTESRQCVVENIIDIIANDTHYIAGKAPRKRKRDASPCGLRAAGAKKKKNAV